MAKAQTGKHGGPSHHAPDTGEDTSADEVLVQTILEHQKKAAVYTGLSIHGPLSMPPAFRKSQDGRKKRPAPAKKLIARVKHAPGAKRTPTGILTLARQRKSASVQRQSHARPPVASGQRARP